MVYLHFRIDHLACSTCATRMQEAISHLPGVGDVKLDFATARLQVALRDSIPLDGLTGRIEQVVQSIEADATLVPEQAAATDADTATALSGRSTKTDGWWRQVHLPWPRILRLATGLLAFVLPWLLRLQGMAGPLLWLLAWLILGADVVWTAVRKLLNRQWLDEHFLMSIATIGALAIGEYPEAVAVMLFYQTGELLQHMAVDHSRRSIRVLLAILPEKALRLCKDGTEQIHPRDAAIGDRLAIRPGDRVPLDCLIKEGTSTMNTSALTGESQLRAAGPGDEIKAGFVNGDALLIAEVLRPEAESAVSRILALVEDAVARKAPAERFITRFARIYTPVMVGLAVLLAILPPLLLGQPVDPWLYRALILIVISCPCALVLSVPLSYFAAIGRASALGILFKGGQYLDQLASVDTIAWDKTGTLTDGTYRVRRVAARQPGGESDVLAWAALIEQGSSHPLARSIIGAWQALSEKPPVPGRVKRLVNHPGRGLEAVVDASKVLLGSAQLLEEQGVALDLQSMAKNRSWPHSGAAGDDGIVLYLAIDAQLSGLIEMSANLRPAAAATIGQLRVLGIQRQVLLSGDQPAAARAVATAVGLDSAAGNLLPEDKVAAVDQLMAGRTGPGRLAYVGDGINDAPVLARADVSLAMGSGSDAALEYADIVILGDDLAKLPQAVMLARKTGRIVRQNIALTLGLKLLIVGLALFGLGGIWQAIFADVGVSLLAVFNALRLITNKTTGQ